MNSKNIIIVAIAVILCVAIAAGTYAYLGTDSNSDSNVNTFVDDSNPVSEADISDLNESEVNDTDEGIIGDIEEIIIGEPSLEIMNSTFSTGHTLSAKTICTLNVKAENVDEVIIKITYSRDGKKLANYKCNATIDENGNIMLESKDSFKKYPDKASIKIYTTDGKLLNSVVVKLKTDDSTQVASGNGTVKAKSVTVAKHSASKADPGAFYSYQDGRTIHTGEVQLAPDGHHWKHLGHNEWVKID